MKEVLTGVMVIMVLSACKYQRVADTSTWQQTFRKGCWIQAGTDSAIRKLDFVDSVQIATMRYTNSRQRYYMATLYYKDEQGGSTRLYPNSGGVYCGGYLLLVPTADSAFLITTHKKMGYGRCEWATPLDTIMLGSNRKVTVTSTQLVIADGAGRYARFQ